jgi:hypothetical protein
MDEEKQGIIPRSIKLLFHLIQSADIETVFTVAVSYFEVKKLTFSNFF